MIKPWFSYLLFSIISSALITSCSFSPPQNTSKNNVLEKRTNLSSEKEFHTDFSITEKTTGIIFYRGEISLTAFEVLKKVYFQAKTPIHTIHIESLGGDGLAGILIGDFIKNQNLNVKVTSFCASSCANYIFTSGKQKQLGKDALIIFHGSLQQANLEEKFTQWFEAQLAGYQHKDVNSNKEAAIDSLSASIKTLQIKYFPEYKAACDITMNIKAGINTAKGIALQCAQFHKNLENMFYNVRNIDEKLALYGQTGSYQKVYESYRYIGFYYEIEELKKMGLLSINLIDGSWSPYKNPHYSYVYPVSRN